MGLLVGTPQQRGKYNKNVGEKQEGGVGRQGRFCYRRLFCAAFSSMARYS